MTKTEAETLQALIGTNDIHELRIAGNSHEGFHTTQSEVEITPRVAKYEVTTLSPTGKVLKWSYESKIPHNVGKFPSLVSATGKK